MWGKLGYPRRALRLHECAGALVERFDGEVPADVETLLSLPGIGAYTARAVAAFAFGQRAAVVDTNVRRVVARAVAGQGEAGPPSTARDLAARGFDVVLGARRIQRLQQVAADCERSGVTARALALDVTDPASVERFTAEIAQADVLRSYLRTGRLPRAISPFWRAGTDTAQIQSLFDLTSLGLRNA